VKPDAGSIYNNLGVSYSMSGRFPEAVEAFKMALQHNFAHAKVYNNLGLALANSERYEEALEAFKKGVEEPLAYNNMGSIYLQAGLYDDAIRCFQTAVELDPRYNARVRKNLQLAQIQKMKAKTQ
jgi:tetratricopeptide (TPR) repeat protein